MLYYFTYKWNVKYKINEQTTLNRNNFIDTENNLMLARRKRVGGLGEKGGGIKK